MQLRAGGGIHSQARGDGEQDALDEDEHVEQRFHQESRLSAHRRRLGKTMRNSVHKEL